MELRRQAEALEAQQPAGAGEAKTSKAKKAPTKTKKAAVKGKKTKEKPSQRKRLVWVVFSPSMKEEGRFAYDQRAAAEEKLEALKLKHKKPYFIQPVKEVISDGSAAPVIEVEAEPEPEPIVKAELDDEDEDEDAEEREEEPEEPEEEEEESDDDE